MVSRIFGGWNGFVMNDFAPAWIASTTRACWPIDVHMMIRAFGSPATICLTAVMPSISGITMSIVTRSGLRARYFSTASTPFCASPTTSEPFLLRIPLIIMRMTTASSTMRTRFPDTAACTPSGQPAVSPFGLPLVDELHDRSILLGFEPVEPQTERDLFGCFDVDGPHDFTEQHER